MVERTCVFAATVIFLVSGLLFPLSTAASPLDYDITNGHFFMQASGASGGDSVGYSITNDGGVPLWSEFQRLSGVAALGYPASRRFVMNGFVSQAMQKTILQWRPDAGQAYFVNLFDLLHEAGKDDWLLAVRQVPPPWDTSPDSGLSWDAVVQRHLAFLDANSAIKARYLADSDPMNHFGLPMSSADMGNVFVLRAQRTVFQYWKTDTPWARAGTVTVANGGDVAKEAGLLPAEALLPEAQAKATKIRWAYYVQYDAQSLESLRQHIDSLDYVSPTSFTVDGNGAIKDEDDPAVTALAKAHNVKVVPLIKNSAREGDFHNVLANPSLRQRVTDSIANLVVSRGFDGIHVDFESLSAMDRPNLVAFMAQLAAALHPKGKLVTMAVAAKAQETTTGWAGPYDYAGLAPYNDLILIMAYGYRTSSSTTPGPNAPISWADGCAAFAAAQIGPSKVLLGLPWYGFDWNTTRGPLAQALRYADATGIAQQHGVPLQYDEKAQAPFFTYSAYGQNHEAWFEDARSFEAKLSLVFKYDFAGAGGWRLGHEDPAVWPIFSRLGGQSR